MRKKTIGMDFSHQEFTDRGFCGYYKDCDFSGSTFTRPTFECVFYNCNFENVTMDCPTIKRWDFFGKDTNLEGLNIVVNKDCEMTSANLARSHPVIAEIMRQKALLLPAGRREKALIASELVKNNPHKCWDFFADNIPKSVWMESDFGFRDKGSILNMALKTRGKRFGT